jgi:hypothetical protein
MQLTGYHLTMFTANQCTSCHNTTFSPGGAYSLTYTGCAQCHMTDYNGTNSPPHKSAGFPTTCDSCHSTTNFTSSTWTHPTAPLSMTGFHGTMLAGALAGTGTYQCTSCHVGNNYSLTYTGCIQCHQTDYNNTTNPNHAASGFPTTCDSCHTFTDWTGAQFTAHDQSYFKIYSGRHNGQWTACSDCHTNAKDYSVFTCIACHQHNNQTSVTSQHNGVKNFSYTPTSCYGCHSAV